MNQLTITMFSNGMSHHQLPLCEYMAQREDVDFTFVATKPVAKERLEMGYEDLNQVGNYILRSYENKDSYNLARKKGKDSDIVIYGSAPYEFISQRLKEKKWTFLYSERIFKNGWKEKRLLKKIVAYFLHYTMKSKKRMALLCASGYAAKDFMYFGLDPQKMYKWGYFPPKTGKNLDELLTEKKENSLLWVGRMISWKHPEVPILVAEKLAKEGCSFHLTMIGEGECYSKIRKMIGEKQLEKFVTLTGSLPKEQVRRYMEQTEIQLATSDCGEGWGAVINEGMSSGCAVIASKAMGAVPFLIRDFENGMTFESGDLKQLYEKTKTVLIDEKLRKRIQQNAYNTIEEEWNGERAGEKLITLCQELLQGNLSFHFEDGVCSFANKEETIWENR